MEHNDVQRAGTVPKMEHNDGNDRLMAPSAEDNSKKRKVSCPGGDGKSRSGIGRRVAVVGVLPGSFLDQGLVGEGAEAVGGKPGQGRQRGAFGHTGGQEFAEPLQPLATGNPGTSDTGPARNLPSGLMVNSPPRRSSTSAPSVRAPPP